VHRLGESKFSSPKTCIEIQLYLCVATAPQKTATQEQTSVTYMEVSFSIIPKYPNNLANVDNLIATRSIQSSLRQCIRIQRMHYQTVAALVFNCSLLPPQNVYIIYIIVFRTRSSESATVVQSTSISCISGKL